MPSFVLIDYPRDKYDDPSRWRESEKIQIDDEQQLTQELVEIRKGRPRVVDLVAPSGDILSIGIRKNLACVLFTQASRMPPYLGAIGNVQIKKEYLEISVGNTPTPIPRRRLLPFVVVLKIAIHFYHTGELLQDVEWEMD